MHISTRQCKTTFCTHYKVLAAEEEGTGTWLPACSPDLSPIENVWRILKCKMRQRRPRTVAHLKTCLQEEWTKLHLKHFITWCLQSLNVFKCCEKEWQHYKVLNALLSQLFLECVAGLNDRKGCIFTNDMKLTRQTWNILYSYCLQWIQVKVNLEITTFFFYLRFPYCPNFFWLGLYMTSVIYLLKSCLETCAKKIVFPHYLQLVMCNFVF